MASIFSRKTRRRYSGRPCGGICPIVSGLPVLKRTFPCVRDSYRISINWGRLYSGKLTELFRAFSHALAVQKRLKEYYIPEITSITHEGNLVEPPQPVPWYPDQLAWSMTTPKTVIRRFPPFASFQKFLVAESEVGNISRQEVVSMIPPLLMDIRPGMTVLDLCAAPGSKSCQLMELIHAGEEERMRQVAEDHERSTEGAGANGNEQELGSLEDDGRSTGLLIANDSDYKRAHMLIHQMKRLNSPNLIVTNHDATMYPSIKLPSGSGGEDKPSKSKYLKFDRILADVPCSGDGTARKNMNVWKLWTPANALGLYVTQLRILLRALQMLKVGGRVVYSTCSLNPVENEAVVAAAIDRSGGPDKVKIVDCSDELPNLKRYGGLKQWNIMDKQGRTWNTWEEVEAQKEKEGIEGLGRLSEGMFPPAGENEDIPLERCMRVYPHQQNTGGFFIAVLEKLTEIKTRPEGQPKASPKAPVTAVVEEMEAQPVPENGEPPAKIDALDEMLPAKDMPTEERVKNASVAESTHLEATSPSTSAKRGSEHLEEESPTKRKKASDGTADATADTVGDRPVHFPPPGTDANSAEPVGKPTQPTEASEPPKKRKPNQPFEEPFKYLDPYHEELVRIYDFYKISPNFPRDRFMVRNAAGKPSKTIYYSSRLARDILMENEGKGIKFVHCGVKMFVKQDVQRDNVCPWRIQTDGLTLLESWVDKDRIVTLTKKDTLWQLLIEMFPKVNDGGWRNLGEIGEWVRDVQMGCCILRIEPTDEEDGLTYVYHQTPGCAYVNIF